jgi:glutamate-1-semialdehyde 2,1-aminomutase
MVESLVPEEVADVYAGTTNAKQFDAIREVIAGGVSSSMRAQAIPEPLVVRRAAGDRIWDVEGRELIDLNMGYGPHLFGYAEPELAAALARQLTEGSMTGLPHVVDREAGELIARLMPSVEQVRFANSGTEAIISALRLARAATGRMKVLTFDGHYHGWSETVLRAGKATFHEPAPESLEPKHGALADPLERPGHSARRVRGPGRPARGGDLRAGDGQRDCHRAGARAARGTACAVRPLGRLADLR